MIGRITIGISLLTLALTATAAEPAPQPAATAAPPAAPATPAAATDEGPDALGAGQITSPPPGAPEDVALWRSGIELSDRIGTERIAANKMQWHAITARLATRLEAIAASESDPGAARAVELLARFRPVLAFNLETLARRWPVDPTRACRYPVMHFEGILQSPESKRRATQLLVTREELQDCVDRAGPALKVLVASNADLKAAIAEVEAFLPKAKPVRPLPPPVIPPKPAAPPARAATPAR